MKLKTNLSKWILILLLISLMALLITACGAGSESAKPTIKLVENPWSASALNVAVAKIILEEEMGYTVEVVTLDESAQWDPIANGDVHASLEVWPSGHADNMQQYITEQGLVENGGPLGPVGKIGWYMPQYMLDQTPALATYEGFKDPANAALFATTETGDKGQFLAGAPGWVQYDADIIKNLGLNLEVVEAGSEEAILSAVTGAYARQEPVLFYFWTPHSIHAALNLVEVQLPPYSDECYAKIDSNGVDCDYPSDELFKIFWVGLSNYAPDAYQLLKNMNYSTTDQITMIASVESDGNPVEKAARDWLAANEATWRGWIPK